MPNLELFKKLSLSSTHPEILSWQEIPHRAWFKVLSILVVLFTFWNFYQHAILEPLTDINVDLDIYCRWSNHIQAGYPYLLNERAPDHPCFYYPPFWGLVMAPLTWVPYRTAQITWYGLNIIWMICLIGIICDWARRESYFSQYWYKYGIFILFMNFTPLFESLRHGQANILILLLLTLVLWFYGKEKPLWAGISLGIATIIKILPLVLIAYWIWKKQWKLVISCILTICLLVFISVGILGISSHLKFIQDNRIYIQFVKEHWSHQNNISIYAILRDGQSQGIFPSSISMYAISLCIALLIMIYLIWRIPTTKGTFKMVGQEYNLILISLFIAVSYAEHQQYLLLFLPYAWSWIYQDQIQNIFYKGGFLFSWILVSMGYYFIDLGLTSNTIFLTRYIHTIGIILLWVLFILWMGIRNDKKITC